MEVALIVSVASSGVVIATAIGGGFWKLSSRLSDHGRAIGRLEGKIDGVDERLGRIDSRINGVVDREE